MHQLTPEQLFAAAVADDGSRPFVTYYDESSGERTELSVRSLANWVAKTHFLLVDELGLGVGDIARIELPAHWISVPIVLGCLTAGLTLSAGDDPSQNAAVAFVADPVDAADGAADVFAVATRSAAVGLRGDAPAGVSDYVAAVRPQADAWGAVHPPAGDATPWRAGQSRGDAVSAARARADALGAGAHARMLTTRDWTGLDDVLDTVLVALVTNGSLVVVRDAADEDVVARRARQELATVVLLPS